MKALSPCLLSPQGGSALSPAAVISPERAQQQAAALAQEVGCPTSPIQEMTSCLRQKPADTLNNAQTKVGTRVPVGKGHCPNVYKWKPRPGKETWSARGHTLPAPSAAHEGAVGHAWVLRAAALGAWEPVCKVGVVGGPWRVGDDGEVM